ncbi:MAG: hypothetical protein KDA60_19715, partial [Planctomycetales bacterium]|nr:hypothetical protein [Planctomycetales bacterium]
WRFQAHNLSYNISVQFDGYEHKYHWIKKGIDFLIDGTKYNRDEPGLTSDIGWFFGHKLSRADERVLFRELFRQDVDYHDKLNAETPVKTTSALGPDQRPDTWLMAHLWYSYAQKTADTKDVQVRGVAPLVFHSYPGKARIDYADAIESEGYLDEVGQEAWRKAGELWNEFGDRSIPNSRGYLIRLNDFEVFRSADRKYWEQLRELGPGVYEQLEAAKLAKLTEEERFIHETSNAELTDEQIGQRPAISRKLEITYEDLANHVPAENRVEAKKLASKARINSALASATSSYRDTINYVYWKIRCEAEQTDTMLAARKYVLEAERLYEETALTAARAEFERAWEKWAEVYEMYPDLRGDVEAEILLEKIVLYQELLGQLSEAFPPPDFKLTSFLEYNSFEYAELAREAFGSATPIGSNVGEVPPSTPDSGESPSASE